MELYVLWQSTAERPFLALGPYLKLEAFKSLVSKSRPNTIIWFILLPKSVEGPEDISIKLWFPDRIFFKLNREGS